MHYKLKNIQCRQEIQSCFYKPLNKFKRTSLLPWKVVFCSPQMRLRFRIIYVNSQCARKGILGLFLQNLLKVTIITCFEPSHWVKTTIKNSYLAQSALLSSSSNVSTDYNSNFAISQCKTAMCFLIFRTHSISRGKKI